MIYDGDQQHLKCFETKVFVASFIHRVSCNFIMITILSFSETIERLEKVGKSHTNKNFILYKTRTREVVCNIQYDDLYLIFCSFSVR